MPRDKNEAKPNQNQPNSLSELLDAYRPSSAPRTLGGTSESSGGAFSSWEAIQREAHGRSARDWRAEWARQRREPLKQSKDWKPALLAVGTVIILSLCIFGVYELDALLNRLHWHWMNPNEAEQPADQPGPAIHWGGQ